MNGEWGKKKEKSTTENEEEVCGKNEIWPSCIQVNMKKNKFYFAADSHVGTIIIYINLLQKLKKERKKVVRRESYTKKKLLNVWSSKPARDILSTIYTIHSLLSLLSSLFFLKKKLFFLLLPQKNIHT